MLLHLHFPHAFLAVGQESGTLSVTALQTGFSPPSPFHLWTVARAHQGEITALAWSCDGLLLASGGNDGLVRLWRTSDGTCWGSFPFALQVTQLHWAGERLLTCCSPCLRSSWTVPGLEMARAS